MLPHCNLQQKNKNKLIISETKKSKNRVAKAARTEYTVHYNLLQGAAELWAIHECPC